VELHERVLHDIFRDGATPGQEVGEAQEPGTTFGPQLLEGGSGLRGFEGTRARFGWPGLLGDHQHLALRRSVHDIQMPQRPESLQRIR
jgi:hypothetical protein